MFNNHTIHDNESLESNFLLLSRVRLIVKFYIWPLLVLFGLTGNCLSILVLTRRRLMRTSTNNYLTILAAFDSCYLIFTLILNFGSHSSFSESSLTQTILFFLRPLADFSSNTATWLIVCFTLERTLAVAKPIYAKRICSVRRSRHLICTFLIVCFLITLPTYFERNFLRDDDNNNNNKNHISFNITERKNSTKQKNLYLTLHRLYLVFICIFIIWIPLTLLCACNSILIWYVHRSRHFEDNSQTKSVYDSYHTTSSASSSTNKSDYSSNNYHKPSYSSSPMISVKTSTAFYLRHHSNAYKQKRKVTIVLIFCLCVALLLWTPQSLSLTYETLIESYSEMSSKRRIILLIFNNFANLFLCLNASIDFILYCFLSEKFARTCKQILSRQCSHQHMNSIQRSRMISFDRTSFILTNTSNNIHQQQQLSAATTTNKYYTQLYHFYRNSSTTRSNGKTQNSKNKFVQTLTTGNNAIDKRVFYRTTLIGNKDKLLSVKTKLNQSYSLGNRKSMDLISTTEDDYTNNELNTSLNTLNGSN